jgi:DNA-binding IclR family transcriptional regulator
MKSQGPSRQKPAPARRYSAPALDKGLDILERLARERLPLSQLELAQALGRTPGEIYRMLACLEERGYVARDADSGKFRLTLRLYELGHRQNAMTLLRKAARLPMEELAEETGQACHLSVQHGRSLLVLMERMPAQRVCLAVGEGAVLPLALTTSGKVLISRMAPDAAAQLLGRDPAYAGHAKGEGRNFSRTLDAVRKQRWIVAASDLSEGVTDIAVPVGVDGTDTAAVLAISQLAGRKQGGAAPCREAAVRCAAKIDRNLGIER